MHAKETVKFPNGPTYFFPELPCVPKEFGYLLINGLVTENSIFSLSHEAKRMEFSFATPALNTRNQHIGSQAHLFSSNA